MSEINIAQLDPITIRKITIALNAIIQKHSQLGGDAGFLGQSTSELQSLSDRIGFLIHYQGGTILFSPSTGAHEIHGAIRDKWIALGAENSFLGYLLTDETPTPDKVGRFNHFERASIYWTPNTGAHEVHGAIRDLWASMGWEQSFLGYPVTDEFDAQVLVVPIPPVLEPGRESQFQNGSIQCTDQTGAFSSPESVQHHADIATQDWAPISGWIDIIFSSQGHFTYQGHIHNSGALNIDFTLVAVIVTNSGVPFQLEPISGHVQGTQVIFEPNRNHNWIKVGADPAIQKHFTELRASKLLWTIDNSSEILKDLQKVVSDLIKTVIAEGAKAIIKLISSG